MAYIGHPVDAPVYIPLADFHRFLFEHKVAEALCLIRSLGAVTVQVVHVEGWDQTVGVNITVPLPEAHQVDIGASASRERGSGLSVLSTMQLKPTHPPSVPAGLVWLPHEPLWQEVAQARLESGLDSFTIDVRSTDDYGVNAGLKALVAKAGLPRSWRRFRRTPQHCLATPRKLLIGKRVIYSFAADRVFPDRGGAGTAFVVRGARAHGPWR